MPQVMECVEVGKIIGHERIVAEIDDLSVPHIIEEILHVVIARPLERSTERIVAQIESGRDSGGGRGVGPTDRGSERNVAQMDDVSLPQVEEILEVVKNVSTERISEHAAD